MKILVVYKSKYGFTKSYAECISQKLAADLRSINQVSISDLQQYDTIILGSGLYAGGVSGISLFTKNFEKLQNKNLYLFTVGVANVTDSKNVASIRQNINKVLTPDMQKRIKLYHLQGGISYSKMSVVHRIMMSMFTKMLSKKPANEISDEDKMIIETYGKDLDFIDLKTVEPIVADIKLDLSV